MWFGGPNQAPAGEIEKTRAGNDALIALAANHPGVTPIATVHPYDGQSAMTELDRVAGRGIKVRKLHPHTQKFDVADPRVLALALRAGVLGVIVLMDNANILPGDSEKLFNLALQTPKRRDPLRWRRRLSVAEGRTIRLVDRGRRQRPHLRP